MKAVLCKAFGPPESLVVEEIEAPRAGEGEAVVAIEAAALNFFDTLIIENKYQYKPEPPFSPAAEFAGKVKDIGPGVTGLAPGDRVMGYCIYGAAREQIAIPAENLIKIPDTVSSDIAAGLIVTYGTSLHALQDRAQLAPGETVAVLGASGGVGIAAIAIAKAMGARVIACASSADKLDFCKEHGADEVINYREEDLKTRLRELTRGQGADVVYDPVGGDYSEAALRSTAWGGRFLVVGFAAGDIPRIPLNLVLLKGLSIVGVFWGDFIRRDPQAHRANTGRILDWVAGGALKPHLEKAYALDDTPAALTALARRQVKGKVVVKP